MKDKDPYKGLLTYRNTPLENGYSPAELSMSRRLKDFLPVVPNNLESRVARQEEVTQREDRPRARVEEYYNYSKGVRQLPELIPGTRVFVKDAKKFGTVIKRAEQPRSYIIQTDTNPVRRNRYTIFPTKPKDTEETSSPPKSTTPLKRAFVGPPEDTPMRTTDQQRGHPPVEGQRTRSGRVSKPPQRLDL